MIEYSEREAKWGAAVLALAIVLGLVQGYIAPALGATSADDVYEIDADHALATDDAIQRFDRQGVVRTNVDGLDLTVTIADDHERLNMSGFSVDSTHRYLRLDYDEQITRTIRIYVPRAYWQPYRDTSLAAANAEGVTADVAPVEGGNYTAITVTLDGPADVVFPINQVRGEVWSWKGWTTDLLEQVPGISLPSFSLGGSAGEWTYLNRTRLAQQGAVPINGSADKMTLQYDAQPGNGTEWLTVPACDGDAESVCHYTRTTNNTTTTYVAVRSGDAPRVRVRPTGGGPTLGAMWRGLQATVERVLDSLGGLFGGGAGG